jgi:CxxC-x17-CxxC domain-containing protein
MDFQDKTLNCRDCNKEFVWTAGEQSFYQEKGFQNPPARCPDCRAARKANRSSGQQYEITCAECGKTDTVPFQPRNPSTVLCSECFKAKRGQQPKEEPGEEPKTEEPKEEPTEEPKEEPKEKAKEKSKE